MSKTHKKGQRISMVRHATQDMGPVALRMRDVARRMDKLRRARVAHYRAEVRALYALVES